MTPMRLTLLLVALAACDGDDKKGQGKRGEARDDLVDTEEPIARTPGVPSGGSGAVRPQPVAPDDDDGGTGDRERAAPQKPAPGAPAPAPGAPVPPAKTPRPIAPMPQGIVQLNDTRWTVTRSLVDQWMQNPHRVANVRESGEGWAVLGVRQRAAYHLGMRNSDVIIEVNGHKLDTKTQLLGAYLDLKNDTEFDVVFLRDGVRRVHHYEIVGG